MVGRRNVSKSNGEGILGEGRENVQRLTAGTSGKMLFKIACLQAVTNPPGQGKKKEDLTPQREGIYDADRGGEAPVQALWSPDGGETALRQKEKKLPNRRKTKETP